MWNDVELQQLFLNKTPLIDVRAPCEFHDGAIPYSTNLPLMNDEERRQVGICYKEQGQEAAIKLGHQFVSGDTKATRINAWIQFLNQNPTAQVFCFRGGLRSQISCQWITEAAVKRTPIAGGYKRLRNFFLSWINEAPLPNIFRLGGLTGSGKTDLLPSLKNSIDLEGLANHRGSAFGNLGAQPTQITFENNLALCLFQNQKQNIMIVEDESIAIGKIMLPTRFFQHMHAAPLIVLTTPLGERIKNIHRDYVLHHEATFFTNAIKLISKRLGGVRTSDLINKLNFAYAKGADLVNHEEWISILLTEYYDPIYGRSLLKQKELILFQGSREEILEWSRNHS
jgi:tRNA 2-selenouridine synthase